MRFTTKLKGFSMRFTTKLKGVSHHLQRVFEVLWEDAGISFG